MTKDQYPRPEEPGENDEPDFGQYDQSAKPNEGHADDDVIPDLYGRPHEIIRGLIRGIHDRGFQDREEVARRKAAADRAREERIANVRAFWDALHDGSLRYDDVKSYDKIVNDEKFSGIDGPETTPRVMDAAEKQAWLDELPEAAFQALNKYHGATAEAKKVGKRWLYEHQEVDAAGEPWPAREPEHRDEHDAGEPRRLWPGSDSERQFLPRATDTVTADQLLENVRNAQTAEARDRALDAYNARLKADREIDDLRRVMDGSSVVERPQRLQEERADQGEHSYDDDTDDDDDSDG